MRPYICTITKTQVRAAAQKSMQLLMEHFSEEDLESYVCPVLEKLASEDLEEEYRTEAIAVCVRVGAGCEVRLQTIPGTSFDIK